VRIFIPTLGREKQFTFETLPDIWKRRVIFVCGPGEKKRLQALGAPVWEQPAEVKGIAGVRQMIMDFAKDEKVVMLDDDLKFAHRCADGKLHPADKTVVNAMLLSVDEQLSNFAHGAVSCREGNNRVKDDITFIGRPLRLLAYNRRMVKETNCRFRLKVMEDFDMTLQLLRAGRENFIIWNFCHDQCIGSGAPGGCSGYRTPAVQAKAAHDLARLHPGFVKIVEKETKTAWKDFGGKRTDVIVYWKKAFESSQSSEQVF